MDWRNRNYYIVRMSSESRHMRDGLLKNLGVKFHPPYNHFAYGTHDGKYHRKTDIISPSYMLSCPEEASVAVEYELRKAVRMDFCTRFFKLSKELLGQ